MQAPILKLLNNPKVTAKFDPDGHDGNEDNVIGTHLLLLEQETNLMTCEESKMHLLHMSCSPDVRLIITQRNEDRLQRGKTKLSFKKLARWLRKNYETRDAEQQLFKKLVSLKQNKSSMLVYLSHYKAYSEQLKNRGRALDSFSARYYLLKGIREEVFKEATKLPTFYSMRDDALKDQLVALDEALPHLSTSRASEANRVNAMIDKRWGHHVASMGGQPTGSEHKGRIPWERKRSERPSGRNDQRKPNPFTSHDMKSMYPPELWDRR